MKNLCMSNLILLNTTLPTGNGWYISEEAVKHALDSGDLDNNIPIILNKNGERYKNYQKPISEVYDETSVIGYVLPNTLTFAGGILMGHVMIQEEYKDRTSYDNWCIDYDKKTNYFRLLSVELY